jgi:hypothetical protein
MIGTRYGDIFKVRNPIRSFHDKLVDVLYGAFFIEFKDSETARFLTSSPMTKIAHVLI